MHTIGIIAFSIATLAQCVLVLLLLTSWRGKAQGGFLIGAAVVQVLWAIVNIIAVNRGYSALAVWVFIAEVLKSGAWLFFIGSVFHRVGRGVVPSLLKWSTFVAPAAVAGLGLNLDYETLFSLAITLNGPALALILMLYNLFGIVVVEQFYRNNNEDNRWRIKFLCFALGGLFAYDFFFYGYSYLMSEVNLGLWLAKGIVNAAIVPFIAISAARNPGWSLDVFVSRRFAFFTTSVVVAGAYLLVMGIGGYYVRQWGGTWGAFLQAIFVSAALLLLVVVFSSGRARSWLKVFISKHFYNYKYDYRDEWLRMMHVLSSSEGEPLTPHEKVVKALAQIVESPSGSLWYRAHDDGAQFRAVAFWHDPRGTQQTIASDAELVSFLETTHWILDLAEYQVKPHRYNNIALPAALTQLPEPWLIVPLLSDAGLDGFVVLNRPRAPFTPTWEDWDLLKTVAQQTTIYLAQVESASRLAETQQFAAFNRLSAYVVHDLNNLVAQLQLVTKNAERHKHNPAFMDDAIKTVQNAVSKMDKLLSQLRKARFEQQDNETVELNTIIEKVLHGVGRQDPKPVFIRCQDQLYAAVNGDRFSAVIGHLIRNAQEASDEGTGRIELRLNKLDGNAVIEIEDNGCGMDEVFISERLFRPFDTTKGNAGMGIGAYESKQFVQNAGGQLEVRSQPGEGTVFKIILPLRQNPEANQRQ